LAFLLSAGDMHGWECSAHLECLQTIVTNFRKESSHPQAQLLRMVRILVLDSQHNYLSLLNILITLVWIVLLDWGARRVVDNLQHQGL
jgi:hypothetical protein